MLSSSLKPLLYRPKEKGEADRRKVPAPFLVMLLATIFFWLLASPFGNFSTNDDWLFAAAVQSLVEKNSLLIPGSNAFNFIPIYMGAAVCKLVGFSHETLRFVTVSFHLLGVLGLYQTVRKLGCDSMSSATLSSTYALNPLLFNLSASFMTDVPALALSNWALYAVVSGLRDNKFRSFLLAVLFVTLSMSVRQTGLVLIPVILISGAISLKTWQDRGLLVVAQLIPLLSYVCLLSWLNSHVQIETGYSNYSSLLLKSILSSSVIWSFVSVLAGATAYFALFLFPISVPLFAAQFHRKPNKLFLLSTLVAVLVSSVPLVQKYMHHEFMPYAANLFCPPFVGTYCLVGAPMTWNVSNLSQFTLGCILIAFITMAVLVYSTLLSRTHTNSQSNRIFAFTLLSCIFVGIGLQVSTMNLDRYYLIGVGPLLCCLGLVWSACKPAKSLICVAIVLNVALGLYATLACADYFSFMRAQHQAIAFLEEHKVDKMRYDAGPVHAFLNGGERIYVTCKPQGWPTKMRGKDSRHYLRWWPVLGEDFIVSTSNFLYNYHAVKQIKYWSSLSFRNRSIFVLQADATTTSKGIGVVR